MKRVSNAIAIVFILVSIAFYIIAGTFPEGTNGAMGPGYFPRIMSVLVICLSCLQLYQSRKEEDVPLHLFSKAYARVWITVGITLVYVLCVNWIGFVVSSIVYMLIMNMYYKVYEKSRIICVILPFIITGVLYYVFTDLLVVVLPSGILI